MSKENAQLGEELEGTTATAETTATDAPATEKPKREKKVYSEDEILAIAKGVEVFKGIDGVSENFVKLLAVVPQWQNVEANKPVKEAVAVEFGGVEAVKAYVTDEENGLAKDIEALSGIKNIFTILGSVKSTYSRVSAPREKKGGKKTQVQIEGKLYKVNAEFLQSLTAQTELSKEDKKAKILAHASLEAVEAIEIL